MVATYTETWVRHINDGDNLIVRTLLKSDDGIYTLTEMQKDAHSPYAMWTPPKPITVSEYLPETWDTHRLWDESQQEWVDVYP